VDDGAETVSGENRSKGKEGEKDKFENDMRGHEDGGDGLWGGRGSGGNSLENIANLTSSG
jgi:hypothetical protein